MDQKLKAFKKVGSDVKITTMSLRQLKKLYERFGVDENEALMDLVGAFLESSGLGHGMEGSEPIMMYW